MFQVKTPFIHLDDVMQVQGWSSNPHVLFIYPRRLPWGTPAGFLHCCECVVTYCTPKSIAMCTVCSFSLCKMYKMLCRQKYWYHDHWCVLSRSLEMLSVLKFPFISSPLLFKCRLQVKCKAFHHNIQQSIWYEICPKWQQKQLIIWITACNGCSLAFFCITEELVTPVNERVLCRGCP